MRKILILAFVTLFLACAKKREPIEPDATESTIRKGVQNKTAKTGAVADERFYKPQIDSLSPSRFALKLEDDDRLFSLFCTRIKDGTFRPDAIVISEKADKTKLQKIKINSDWTFLRFEEMGFSIADDANFDGFRDLCLSNYTGMYTTTLSFWLYDTKRGKFVHEPSLDSIQNPNFDLKTKRILSSWHAGLSTFSNDIYIWKNGKAILLESTTEIANYPETQGVHYEIRRLVNGKYVEKDSVVRKRG